MRQVSIYFFLIHFKFSDIKYITEVCLMNFLFSLNTNFVIFSYHFCYYFKYFQICYNYRFILFSKHIYVISLKFFLTNILFLNKIMSSYLLLPCSNVKKEIAVDFINLNCNFFLFFCYFFKKTEQKNMKIIINMNVFFLVSNN